MHFIVIYANARRDAIVLTFPGALVLFVLYVEKYEVKCCKTLVFYSFACQYCNDSFVIVFSYLRATHACTHIIRLYGHLCTCILDTGLFLRTFEF